MSSENLSSNLEEALRARDNFRRVGLAAIYTGYLKEGSIRLREVVHDDDIQLCQYLDLIAHIVVTSCLTGPNRAGLSGSLTVIKSKRCLGRQPASSVSFHYQFRKRVFCGVVETPVLRCPTLSLSAICRAKGILAKSETSSPSQKRCVLCKR